MKELSIEEKAKRYDKVIKQIKECTPDENGFITIYPQEIFPELQESEDERIRKEIIAIIKSQKEQQCHVDGAVYDKMIDWLEKLEDCEHIKKDWLEHIKQSWYKEGFIDGKYSIGKQGDTCESPMMGNKKSTYGEKRDFGYFEEKPTDKVEPKFKIGDTMRTLQEAANGITDGLPVVVSIDDESYHCNNEIIYIKNQNDYEYPPMNRKQESESCEAIEFPFKAKVKKNDKIVTIISGQLDDIQPKDSGSYIAYSSDVTDGYKVYKPEELEFIKQSKFHKGDWVIDKQGVVHQIANVVENVTNHTYGYDIVGGGYFNDDTEGVRLWTVINDAKNGDILQAGKCTIIFDGLDKDLSGNTVIRSWYFSDSTKFHGMGPSQPDLWLIDGISPSTKEQRELLFAYMKDAGYEWDADKKEPKKIEQVEPKFHEGDWITNKEDVLWQIDEVRTENYLLIDSDGILFAEEIAKIDSEFHLWTFQEDVKDGDILATGPINSYPSPFVAIYKSHGLDFFNSYCFIGFDGKFYEGETGHSIENIHPATKEQCDALEKAMTNASYRWNAETKELSQTK